MEYIQSRFEGYLWDLVQHKKVRSVYALTRGGKPELYVKVYHPVSVFLKLRNLIYPKTLQEAHTLERLRSSGLPVPEVVTHLRHGPISALVTKAVYPSTSLVSLPEERQIDILCGMAARLLGMGFTYGDCHAGNIVLDGTDRPILVDAYAVSPLRAMKTGHVVSLFSQIAAAYRVPGEALQRHLAGLLPPEGIAGAVEAIRTKGLASRIRLVGRRAERTLREGSFSRHVTGADYEAFVSRKHQGLQRLDAAGWRCADYESSVTGSRPLSLDTVLEEHARNLSQGTNVLKLQKKTQLSQVGDLCVKSYARPKPFTSPYALRSWKGLMTLYYNNIPVAEPVAVVLGKDRTSVLITGMVSGQDLNRVLFHEYPAMSLAEKRALARALGGLLGTMHGYGIFHADLKSSNIRVLKDPLSFVLLDTDKVRQGRSLSRKKRIRNMAQINRTIPRHVSQGVRMAFVRAYAKITREDPKALFREVWALSSRGGIAYRTDQGDRSESW